MTATPALEAPPPTLVDLPEANPGRTGTRRPARGGLLDVALPWLRLAALLLAAAATQMIYVFMWPLSYFMTQARDYTYEYLVQYPAAWERLQLLLARFEQFWPGASLSLDFLVDALMQAFIAASVLYLVVIMLVRGGLPPLLGTVAVTVPPVAFHLTLFFMPGLYTTDMFSYAMYSHIAGVLNANPYTSAPSWFQDVRIFHWIHPLWQNAPSIYGPAWIDLTVPLARLVANASDVDKVLAYKALVNVGHAFGVGALAYVVHRLRPGHALEAVAMFAWNPLIIFEFGGNGHNDAVMVATMLVGLALYVSAARWLGVVAVAISVLLKMTSLFVLPFYAMAWARDQRTWLRFFAVGALATVTALVVFVAFYAPWWQGVATISPILTWSQGPMFNNYVPDIVAYALAGRDVRAGGGTVDPAIALEAWRNTIKTVARVFFICWIVVELWRVRGGLGIAGASARVMLVFLVAVNTWVLPWYFSWPLALAIILGWDTITAKVLVGFSLSAPTVMYYHHFWHPYMSDTTYLLYLAPLLVVPIELLSVGIARVWRNWRRTPISGAADSGREVGVLHARR